MKTSTIWITVAVLVVVLAGWYWLGQRGAEGTPGEEQSEGAAMEEGEQPQTGTTVATNPGGHDYTPGNLLLGTDGNATLGTYLIGSSGMTLYTYAPDTAGVSNCTGQCAVNWPPYTIADASVLANLQAGVNGKAGFLTRADGSMQVTYNGHPLYFYAQDAASGDTNGQGIGGVWYVVAP